MNWQFKSTFGDYFHRTHEKWCDEAEGRRTYYEEDRSCQWEERNNSQDRRERRRVSFILNY